MMNFATEYDEDTGSNTGVSLFEDKHQDRPTSTTLINDKLTNLVSQHSA